MKERASVTPTVVWVIAAGEGGELGDNLLFFRPQTGRDPRRGLWNSWNKQTREKQNRSFLKKK